MTAAGDLRHRVTIEAPLGAPDDQGGEVRVYANVGTAWAAITPLAGARDVDADADGANLRFRIVVRAPLTLSLRHRLREGARLYRIVAFRDSDDRGFILIDAEQRID